MTWHYIWVTLPINVTWLYIGDINVTLCALLQFEGTLMGDGSFLNDFELSFETFRNVTWHQRVMLHNFFYFFTFGTIARDGSFTDYFQFSKLFETWCDNNASRCVIFFLYHNNSSILARDRSFPDYFLLRSFKNFWNVTWHRRVTLLNLSFFSKLDDIHFQTFDVFDDVFMTWWHQYSFLWLLKFETTLDDTSMSCHQTD